MSNGLDPEQDLCSVRPDLEKISADDKTSC